MSIRECHKHICNILNIFMRVRRTFAPKVANQTQSKLHTFKSIREAMCIWLIFRNWKKNNNEYYTLKIINLFIKFKCVWNIRKYA